MENEERLIDNYLSESYDREKDDEGTETEGDKEVREHEDCLDFVDDRATDIFDKIEENRSFTIEKLECDKQDTEQHINIIVNAINEIEKRGIVDLSKIPKETTEFILTKLKKDFEISEDILNEINNSLEFIKMKGGYQK